MRVNAVNSISLIGLSAKGSDAFQCAAPVLRRTSEGANVSPVLDWLWAGFERFE